MKPYIPCIECGKKATWSYMPGDENYCDEHVPRGCSCNQDENGIEALDPEGRKYPCCEYSEIHEDYHNDEMLLNIGWETYYKYNHEKYIEENDFEFKDRKSRRTRLKEILPDQKEERNSRNKKKLKIRPSKPKRFKHNRKLNQKSF